MDMGWNNKISPFLLSATGLSLSFHFVEEGRDNSNSEHL
jgi:hypothetical protein